MCSSSSESSSELISKSGGLRKVQPSSTNFKFDNWYVNVFIFAATISQTKSNEYIRSYYDNLWGFSLVAIHTNTEEWLVKTTNVTTTSTLTSRVPFGTRHWWASRHWCDSTRCFKILWPSCMYTQNIESLFLFPTRFTKQLSRKQRQRNELEIELKQHRNAKLRVYTFNCMTQWTSIILTVCACAWVVSSCGWTSCGSVDKNQTRTHTSANVS